MLRQGGALRTNARTAALSLGRLSRRKTWPFRRPTRGLPQWQGSDQRLGRRHAGQVQARDNFLGATASWRGWPIRGCSWLSRRTLRDHWRHGDVRLRCRQDMTFFEPNAGIEAVPGISRVDRISRHDHSSSGVKFSTKVCI